MNNKNSFLNEEDITYLLWGFIDGTVSLSEKKEIEELLLTNTNWQNKYEELLATHQLIQQSELEHPSMRFTKNVMEKIAKYQIAPATKTYINKNIIRGIAFFFISLIACFVIYGFSQVDWSASTNNKSLIDFSKFDLGKIFNSSFVNILMMINVVLVLMLFDRYLANRRKSHHKEA